MHALLYVVVAAASLSSALADELSRLRGQRVVVAADCASYTIEDIAGEGRPLVGIVDRRGDRLWLRTSSGDLELSGPLARPRMAGPGYKIWVIGELVGARLEARRLGVLARPTAECSRLPAKEPPCASSPSPSFSPPSL